MTKKIILLTLCSLLLAPCSAVKAQQPKKVPLIGYLSPLDPVRESTRADNSAGCYVDVKTLTHECSLLILL